MLIDLNTMDTYEDYNEEAEEALDDFIETLTEQFFDSLEGKSLLTEFPESGFWVPTLIEYSYQYEGFSLPQMMSDDVEYIVSSIFPRKITLGTRKDAEDAIPELIAFWQYLGREYHLKQADAVIKSLDRIAPRFADMMFDESRAGMAKSMMMAGQDAGFDMSDPEQLNKFMHLYNAQQLQGLKSESNPSLGAWNPFGSREQSVNRQTAKAKKNKRKATKASKKKNRKKKKK